MRVAIIHEWLVTMGGSEKVLQSIVELFPMADIYCLVADKNIVKKLGFKNQKIYTSFIQKLPFSIKKYKSYLPLFPLAVEQFDVSNYDLVISSSHAVAKGVLTDCSQLHITYCHTPIRYAWDLYHQYLKETKIKFGFKGWIVRYFLHKVRIWDFIASQRPDIYISNSNFIGERIKKVYNRDSITIYPPIEMDKFELEIYKENFFVTSSRMVPYKKIDLIVEAFSKMPDKKLIVIGDGPDFNKIKRIATSNVLLKGYLPHAEMVYYLKKAKGFVFAAIEDFGMLPVEAQACGTPVLALGKGGVLESVIPNVTGVLFEEQTVSSLMVGIIEFEKKYPLFDFKQIRLHAEKFSKERFNIELKSFIEKMLKDKVKKGW
ncbi:MAG: glycosyltransferase [Bacteroidetes bacterium]|nr:glycosyltransferase [Bacteroidota bacterium]